MSKVSVIICTHNPRRDYLQRTLEGLRGGEREEGWQSSVGGWREEERVGGVAALLAKPISEK